MSALARWFKHHNFAVFGYDRVRTQLCSQLEAEGMLIHYHDDPSALPEDRTPENMLVIYTPAIPKNHRERQQLLDEGFHLYKRSEILGIISQDYFTVAVGGTHGKTTTSSMISHIFKTAGKDLMAFLGGISADLNSNFIANLTTEAIAVVEADEFDRSFLTLHPNLAVITHADADHLDIYGDRTHLLESFKLFAKKLVKGGTLYINDQFYKEIIDTNDEGQYKSYGINRGQFLAHNVTIKDGFFQFDFQGEEKRIHELKMGVPGFHNVENAVAAICVALQSGVSDESIREALRTFKGVKRRFEFVYRGDITFIDDYAHHPTEITAFIKSVRALYPDRKVTVIFQPHLYSRTRDFATGFAESLSLADEVILLEVYPAREEPIPGVDSELIFKGITCNKKMRSKEDVLSDLNFADQQILCTVGAGDIDTLVPEIENELRRVYESN